MEMGFLTIHATAASLAMDAFSVSVCVGLASPRLKLRNGLILGGVFGFFQFVMPLAGACFANLLTGFLNSWAPFIAAALIVFVALKMIVETYRHGPSCPSLEVNMKNMLAAGLATSLDALAVGFSIKSAGGSAALMAFSAGFITFALSLLGSIGGGVFGEKIGYRAQYIGGAVLLLIAANIAFR